MSTRPNLFEEATSELSQDAFICWLVKWVNCGEDPQLQQHAKDFVAMLHNSTTRPGIAGSDVESVSGVERQYAKIDVLFVARVSGQDVVFLIEDKTATQHHSDQLARYVDEIENSQAYSDKPLVCVYYKTGFLFEGREDTKVLEDHYGIVDYRRLRDFFDRESDNAIFRDYAENVRKESAEIRDAIARLMQDGDDSGFASRAAQWSFIRDLQSRLADEELKLNRGTNAGGQPFTELRFHFGSPIHGKVSEKLMYRIEKRKDGFTLSLRQYAPLSWLDPKEIDVASEQEKKLARLSDFREAFEAAKGESATIQWAKPRKDKKGANSSEIAVLLFGTEVNTPQQVLSELPVVHRAFRAAIA